MDWLYQEGYFTDPCGKAKSVGFTEEGLDRAKSLPEKTVWQARRGAVRDSWRRGTR
jgi:hypothetical protein